MKKYFIFFILIYFAFTQSAHAIDVSNTGFVPGQIWYSKDTIVEGDTVKVYTAVWNNSTSPLSTKVEFYDQNVILGTRDIVVNPLELKETDISWKVTAGDHIITAKIISPSVSVSGKKQAVVVDNFTTEASHTFVPVVVQTINGQPATSTDVIKSQIDKATSSLDNILPTSITTPVSQGLNDVSTFRNDVYNKVSTSLQDTKKSLDLLNIGNTKVETPVAKTDAKVISPSKTTTGDQVSKPMAYIKLFFLSILSFLFGSSLVFYSVIILVLFFIIRFIYSKIRNR